MTIGGGGGGGSGFASGTGAGADVAAVSVPRLGLALQPTRNSRHKPAHTERMDQWAVIPPDGAKMRGGVGAQTVRVDSVSSSASVPRRTANTHSHPVHRELKTSTARRGNKPGNCLPQLVVLTVHEGARTA
jgi:hypothetical protein